RPGDGPRDLADLEGMGQPRAEMMPLVMQEDLRLVLKPAEGGGMDDAVAVALEFRARRAGRSGKGAAPAQGRTARIGREPLGVLRGRAPFHRVPGILGLRVSIRDELTLGNRQVRVPCPILPSPPLPSCSPIAPPRASARFSPSSPKGPRSASGSRAAAVRD